MRLCSILLCIFFSLPGQAQEGGPIQTVQSPLSNKIEHAFISSDNQVILAGDITGYVFFWRKGDGTISKIMRVHNQSITQMAVSGDSKYFATTSTDNKIFLWDFNSGKKVGEVSLENSCTALGFNENSSSLIYTSGNTVFKAAVSDLNNSVSFYQSELPISCGTLVHTENYFAIGAGHLLLLLNTADGKVTSQKNTCAGLKLSKAAQIRFVLMRDGLSLLNGRSVSKKRRDFFQLQNDPSEKMWSLQRMRWLRIIIQRANQR